MTERRLLEAYFRWPVTESDDDLWASEIVDEAVWKRPKEAWVIFLDLLDYAPDEEAIAFLAAGPREDLLVHHGDLMFDVIAIEARNNPKLRMTLDNVWITRAPKSIQRRFHALRELPEP